MKLEKDIKYVQRVLMGTYLSDIAIALAIVAIFQLELLEITNLMTYPDIVFWLQVLMELLTICVIPMALRLFKLKKIHNQLMNQKAEALMNWGLVRIHLIGIPMLMNAYLYEQTQSPAFGYMAIILFLANFFITPTLGRCKEEVAK